MTDPSHAPMDRGAWFPWSIRIAWILVYLHCMAQAGWDFMGPAEQMGGALAFLGIGFPGVAILNLHGAAVPFLVSEGGDWHRLLLDPFVESSLISLVFTLLIWGGLGGMLYQIAGAARSWIVFVAGGAASALALVVFHPHDVMGGAGSSGTYYAALGALAVFGFSGSSPLALAARRRALSFGVWIVLFTVAFAFVQGGVASIRWSPLVAGVAAGALSMLAFGPTRVQLDTGLVTRGIALLLLAFVGMGAVHQVPRAMEGVERIQRVQDFQRKVIAMERAANRVRDPLHATDEQRQAVADAIAAVVSVRWIKDWEGHIALLEWVGCFEAYATGDVPDPSAQYARINRAFEGYLPYEQALMREVGLRPREESLWVRRF